MSLTYRRIVFYLLVMLFFVIAPLVMAYTAGYRWSATQKRIVKTGALSIRTTPPDAAVILNNKPYPGRTPVLIVNLIPATYDIQLKKEGYHSWQKTLPVQSEHTAFAHHAALFKITEPHLVTEAPPAPSAPTPERFKHFSVFPETKTNRMIVVDNERQIRIAEIPGMNAVWRQEEEPLLFVYSGNEVWKFDPNRQTIELVTRLIEEIQNVITLPNLETILLIFKNRVSALELDNRDRQNVWDLATFDSIKTAALADDGKTLLISGPRQGQEGVWKLELY